MHSYWHHFIVPTVILLTLQLGCSGGGYEEAVDRLDGDTTIQIDLSNTAVTDADLLEMEFPKSLRVISLQNTAISDDGVEALLDAENLEQVILSNTEITSASMEILEQLPKLRSLDIAGKNINKSVAFDFYKKILSKNPPKQLGNRASQEYLNSTKNNANQRSE